MTHEAVEKRAELKGETSQRQRECPRGPTADFLAHDEADIEGGDVDEHPFEDVVTVSQVDTAQCSGLQTVSEGAFQQLAPLSLQRLATGTFDSTAIRLAGQLSFAVILPAATTAVRLGGIASDAGIA